MVIIPFFFEGALPHGYASEAKLMSEQTHQIPWDYHDSDNQENVFEEIVNFLMVGIKLYII